MSITTSQSPGITDDAPTATDGQVLDEDWDNEPLPVRPVRRRLGPITLLLIGLLIGASAFTGGVIAEKGHVGTAGTSTTRSAATTASAAGRAGFGAAAGGGGAASGAGGATSGTVKLIDGANIYITNSAGTIVKVATTPQSQISISAPGAVTAVKPGDTVTVTGSTGSNGTVTATSVRDAGSARASTTTGQGGPAATATPAG
jgi:hypothetical protein